MNSHDLANQLLALPDMPVKLFTDHGQTSSTAHQIDVHLFSASEEYSHPGEENHEAAEDEIKVIEIYGE